MESFSPSLVSIIIPVYNTEQYLEEALKSCLQQTYDFIEVICVDNNSTDESREILERYALKFPDKIKVFEENEKGAPAARNKGMKEAGGEYIHFLDSDDVLEKNSIQLLISEMNGEVDGVSGSATYYKNNFDGSPVFERKRISKVDNQLAHILNNHPDTGSLLLKKSAVKNVKWDNNLGAGQELVFWSELVLTNNAKIKYIPETVCKIRIHHSPHRISNQNRKIRVEIHYRVILKIEMLLKSSPFKSPIAEIALNDRKLRNAFNAIHAKNFRISYLLAKRIDKKLVKRSTNFKWFSREGVFCISNLYAGFLFYFFNYKLRKRFSFFFH